MHVEQPFAVPGTVLEGKFRIERVLGQGGMGIVVAATHLQLEQQVALKFLLPHACSVPNAIARFMQEARAAARIRGDHIGRVMDVAVLGDGTPYIVMEFLEGRDLAQVLEAQGPLPVDVAVGYLLQACEAISEAHSLGIVHRDLKPANLFLTHRANGTPLLKVLDFGISKSLGDSTTSPSLTGTAFIMGSPQYMSPEQVRSSKHVDTRTDIWSLGIIGHELLTGRPPFVAETAPALLVQIAVEAPESIRTRRPDLPVELEQILLRCLSKDPNDRIQTVGELAQLLAPFASATRAPVTTTREGPTSTQVSDGAIPAVGTVPGWYHTQGQERRRKFGPIAMGVGAAVTVLVAASVYWMGHPRGTGTAASTAVSGSASALTTLTTVATATIASATTVATAERILAEPVIEPRIASAQVSPVTSATSVTIQAVPAAPPPKPKVSGPVAPSLPKGRPPKPSQIGGSVDPLDGRR